MSSHSLTVATLILVTTLLLTVRPTVSKKSRPVVYVQSGRGAVSSPDKHAQKKSDGVEKPVAKGKGCRCRRCQPPIADVKGCRSRRCMPPMADVEGCRNKPCQSLDVGKAPVNVDRSDVMDHHSAGEASNGHGSQSSRCSRSSLHMTPTVVKPRGEIPDDPHYTNGKLHIAINLGELVVKRSSEEGCEENVIHQSAVGVVPKKTLDVEKNNNNNNNNISGNKKKTMIGSNPDFKSIVNVVLVNSVRPQKRLTITTSTGTKKTIDSKNSISSLIAAVKARENLTTKTLALFNGVTNNTKPGIRKGTLNGMSNNGSSSNSIKKESFADVFMTSAEPKAPEAPKRAPSDEKAKLVPSKVTDAGKSILAAIDDKEGLRAALAKAIDRVEKVVANKNGALAVAKKIDNEKKNESKITSDMKSNDALSNKTVHSNSTESKNTTGIHESGSKATDINNSTDNGTAAAEALNPPEKDPYAEIAMGPDKPKIPELKGEEGDTGGAGALMKVGDQNVQQMGAAGAGGAGIGDGKPLAGMHDVGGLLDSLTDKVNLADTKRLHRPHIAPQNTLPGIRDPAGLLDQAQERLNQMDPKVSRLRRPAPPGVREPAGLLDQAQEKFSHMDTKGLGQQQPSPGVQDPAGMLDRAQEKFNQMDSKAETQPGAQDPGGLLDRATEKFNTMGGGIATDNPPMDNNEVKYIQSQLNDVGEEPSTNKMMEKMRSNDGMKQPLEDSLKPMEEPIKPMGADDAMKALTGDDISMPSQAFKTNNEAIKTLQKDDTFNPIKTGTIDGGDEDGAMKGMSQMKEDGSDGVEESPHKESDSSENLVKDILDKASSLNMGAKGGTDDTFKELQGADISAGPDPYESDKPGDSYGSMYGGGQVKNKYNDEDNYGDMANDHEMNDGMPTNNAEVPYGDGYEKNEYGTSRENIESNEEQPAPARSRGRGPESYLNAMGNENEFTTRQNIPATFWSGSRIVGPNADSFTSDTFNDNYNTQMFKKNVIMRPERDYYVSPFNGKDSFEIDM